MNRRQVVVAGRSERTIRLLQIAAVALFICFAVLMYEVGMNSAGFSRISALDKNSALKEDNKELQAEAKQLRERVAVLETAATVDREAYRQVEQKLIELQSRILEQQEDLEFYKGIVNADDGGGLRIQNFQVSQGLGEREFGLRLVLAQAFRSTRQVSGQVELVVEGMQEGEPARLGLADIGATSDKNRLSYSFKYFQDLKAEVLIPSGFVPERVHVIVHPKGESSKTVEDFFVWSAKQG
jgi:hypothetical protein